MIKKMLLALCLIFSAEARAQFAAGYAPVRPEAAPSGEEQQSVLFRQTPAPAEAAPRPAEPENIRKPTPYTGSIRILAQVNGDIITTEDINHRVRAFCMTTGIPYNRQTKLLIINKVMQNTIDEKLKAQEAARSQIEIGEKEIDNAVGVFCQNNGISRSRLSQMLKDSGVSPEVFREQLKTDLAWIRVVHRGTMGETITQPEIEEALAIAKRDMSKPKFMLSEIVISAKDAKHISQLAENLRQDPRLNFTPRSFRKARVRLRAANSAGLRKASCRRNWKSISKTFLPEKSAIRSSTTATITFSKSRKNSTRTKTGCRCLQTRK